jgi:hypothetical protein
MAGPKPDYDIGALNRATGEKNNYVGAAWRRDDGTISIKLNAFVVLRGSEDLFVTLFPRDNHQERTPARRTAPAAARKVPDDEIPF